MKTKIKFLTLSMILLASGCRSPEPSVESSDTLKVSPNASIQPKGNALFYPNPKRTGVDFSMAQREYQAWKTKYLQICPDQISADVKQNDTHGVSEGAAYGLLLAAGFKDKATFDRILNSVKLRTNQRGLMNWRFPLCGKPQDAGWLNSATDAELDIAFGLIKAFKNWKDVSYKKAAIDRIHAIKAHQTTICNGTQILEADDNTMGCETGNSRPRINPSYYAPGYFRVFAAFDTAPGHREFWRKMVKDSYEVLSKVHQASDGLMADWGYFDGTPDGPFGYESCRMPWRLLFDYQTVASSPWESLETKAAPSILRTMNATIDKKGGLGKTGHDRNSCFLGGFALTAAAVSQDKLDQSVNDWIGAIKEEDNAYYQGTLRVLYLLLVTGHGTY